MSQNGIIHVRQRKTNDMYDMIMIRYYLQPDKVELDSFLKKNTVFYIIYVN